MIDDPAPGDRLQRVGRLEACLENDGGACMQRRQGLDVEPADMEHRQESQDPVGADEVVHRRAVDGIPLQRVLGQHRALRPPCRARGVDDQYRVLEPSPPRRRAIVLNESGVITPALAGEAESDQMAYRQLGPDRLDAVAKLRIAEQHRRLGVLQDIAMLRRRQPPVQRHADRADPRAGQHERQELRTVVGEDRDAVARSDLQLMGQRRG
jgi:hypothetical protein